MKESVFSVFIAVIAIITAIFLINCYTPNDNSNAPNTPVTETVATTEDQGYTTSCDPNLSAYLNQQLTSDEHSCWLEVVECPQATAEHLERAAKRCSWIVGSGHEQCACDIAEAIASHPNATDHVMSILAKSDYHRVWRIVASAPKSADEALAAVAKRCSWIVGSGHEQCACDIAEAIASHPNATKNALTPLEASSFSSVLSIGHQAIELLSA